MIRNEIRKRHKTVSTHFHGKLGRISAKVLRKLYVKSWEKGDYSFYSAARFFRALPFVVLRLEDSNSSRPGFFLKCSNLRIFCYVCLCTERTNTCTVICGTKIYFPHRNFISRVSEFPSGYSPRCLSQNIQHFRDIWSSRYLHNLKYTESPRMDPLSSVCRSVFPSES